MKRNNKRWITKLIIWQPGDHMGNRGKINLKNLKTLTSGMWDQQGWQELGKAYIQQYTYQG